MIHRVLPRLHGVPNPTQPQLPLIPAPRPRTLAPPPSPPPIRRPLTHARPPHTTQVMGLAASGGLPTVKEITKAFRQQSLLVHPDKNSAPEAEEAFKRLQVRLRMRMRMRLPSAEAVRIRKQALRCRTRSIPPSKHWLLFDGYLLHPRR